MDDVADRAHWGMTVQMEHTPRKDPLRDEGVLISELHIFYIICAAWLMMQYFSDEKFSSLENTEDPPWQMTSQTEHTTQGSTDGRQSKRSTPRIGIQWRMMQQTKHTVYSAASHE